MMQRKIFPFDYMHWYVDLGNGLSDSLYKGDNFGEFLFVLPHTKSFKESIYSKRKEFAYLPPLKLNAFIPLYIYVPWTFARTRTATVQSNQLCQRPLTLPPLFA